MLSGQAVSPDVRNLLDERADWIINDFEVFIEKLQSLAIKNMRDTNNLLCRKVCKSSSKILNLTESPVPAELEKMLSKGINFVPQDNINCKEIKNRVEQDLIAAAINFYRDEYKVYPMVDAGLGLKTVLEQLISQAPSNTKQIEFYSTMYNEYISHKGNFYDQLSSGHFMDTKTAQK